LSAYAFKNEPSGYGDIFWGKDISALKDMKFLRHEGKKKEVGVYKREGDPLLLGDAVLKSIEYKFMGNKLFSVVIRVGDLLNFIRLRGYCFAMYGEGKELLENTERYYWDGTKVKITLISAFDIS